MSFFIRTYLLLLWFCTAQMARGGMRPHSELTSNCFGFPASNFDRDHCIEGEHGTTPVMMLDEDQDAIDFTLHDPHGNAWNLRDALDGRKMPVVMIWGMYTCPAYQGMGTSPPWEKCGYRDEYDLVESHKDRATFIHLYGAEPHPVSPATNFDHGITVTNYWSTVGQAMTYQERLGMAARIQHLTHPAQVMLLDYLPGNPYSDLIQPVWCSYSLGARPAIVISPEGTVFFQQEWLQTEELGNAIDRFWAAKSD